MWKTKRERLEILQSGECFVELGYFVKNKKTQQENILEFFLLDTLKTTFCTNPTLSYPNCMTAFQETIFLFWKMQASWNERNKIDTILTPSAKECLWPCQASEMELFSSIIDIWDKVFKSGLSKFFEGLVYSWILCPIW